MCSSPESIPRCVFSRLLNSTIESLIKPFTLICELILIFISRNRSPAAKKVEKYAVDRVKGDGRCLFRALVM